MNCQKKVKAISTKGLTKYLINKFIITNGAEKISFGIFQNYLVFMGAMKYIKYFHTTIKIYSRNVRRKYWKYN